MKGFVLTVIILALCFFACIQVSADVTDDAVLVLRFDEGSGNFVHDNSGYGNDGEIHDTVIWGEGVSGTPGLFFDGTQGYVEIPDSPSIEPQHFTISVWIKPGIPQDDIDYALPIISKTNGDRWFYVDGYDLTLGENGIGLGIASRSNYRRGPNAIMELPVNQWSHIVATYDKNEARIYVDGELKTSIQASYGIYYGSDDLWIGRFYQVGSSHSGGMDRKGFYYFNGGIDEVFIFPRALSESEVSELYQSYDAGDTSASITSFTVEGEGGAKYPGDTVTATAEVSNDGDTPYTFGIEYTIWDASDTPHEVYDELVEILPGMCMTFDDELTWTIPEGIAEGPCIGVLIVYEPSDPLTHYDTEFVYDAFFVQFEKAPELILDLNFNDENPGTATDSSGNGNDGTIYGATYIEGISGKALNFDGVNDYVDLGNLQLSNSEGTIEAWIYPEGFRTYNQIFSACANPISKNVQFRTSGWFLEFYITETGGSNSHYIQYQIPPDKWYHVVVTHDGQTTKLYVNGSMKSSMESSLWFDDLPELNQYTIGNLANYPVDYPNYHFDGTIDEVKVYSKALSGEEIMAEYEGYLSDLYPGDISIEIGGGENHEIGDILELSGINTASDTTYLMITGPKLRENGVHLNNLTVEAVTGDEMTFIQIPVKDDDTWEYTWNIFAFEKGVLFPGEYIIYAVSEPKNKAALVWFPTWDSDGITLELPEKFSWHDFRGINWMTPVKDQGLSGACAVFATVGAIEAKYNIEEGENLGIDLSEYEVYYHVKLPGEEVIPGTGGGGTSIIAAANWIENNGIVDEECCPHDWYIPGLPEPTYYQDRLSEILDVKFDYYKSSYTNEDFKAALISVGPIPASLNPDKAHAVVFTGWDDEGSYWILKNSHGNGFFWDSLLNPIPIGYGIWRYSQCKPGVTRLPEHISPPEILNPSAVYCDALGFDYWIESTAEGDCGYCRMPDGQKVDAWAFLTGVEGQEYSYCALKGRDIKTVQDENLASKFLLDHCAVCADENNTEKEVTELMGLSFESSEYYEMKSNYPNIQPIDDIVAYVGETIEILITATDPTDDPLTISSANLPEGAILVSNKYTWTPNANQTGQYYIPFCVNDGQLESFVFANITVKAINHVSLNEPISPGWSLFSTPVTLDPANSTLDRIFDQDAQQHIEVILGWDGSQWFLPDPDYQIQPLHALAIKTDDVVTATLMPSSEISAPPSRTLSEGANLVGCAPACTDGTFQSMSVDEAFQCIEASDVGTGYVMVISPAWNQPGWACVRGGTPKDLLPYKGYWVVMENDDTLYGFSTTPVG